MVVETSVDGESLFQKVKNTSGVTVSMFTMLENISHSIRTASLWSACYKSRYICRI